MGNHFAENLRPKNSTERIRHIPNHRPATPTIHKHTPEHGLSAAGAEPSLLAPYIKQAVCLLDGDGHCRQLTENWQNITGHAIQLSLGPNFLRLFHPSHRKRILNKLEQAEHGDAGGSKHVHCQFRHADGSWRWVELRIAGIRREETSEDTEGDDAHAEFICTVTDITREIETEQKLRRAKLKAELAAKGREDFLANMSHELRTPLNAILGFAQMMDKQVYGRISNPKYRDYLGNIQESGNLLLSKINDLLAISSLNMDENSMTEQLIPLDELLQEVVESRSHKAFRKQVTVRLSLPKGREISLNGDKILLRQALSNILGNAIRYNKAKGKVTIAAKLSKEGDLALTFSDTGEGMSPARLRYIRQLLTQKGLERSTEEERALSLMLANEFLRLHDGGIHIVSKKDQGTTVTLNFPAYRVSVDTPPRQKRSTKVTADA